MIHHLIVGTRSEGDIEEMTTQLAPQAASVTLASRDSVNFNSTAQLTFSLMKITVLTLLSS